MCANLITKSMYLTLCLIMVSFIFPVVAEEKNGNTVACPSMTFSSTSDKTHRFSSIQSEQKGQRIEISGRIQSPGKTIRGHVDAVLYDSLGSIVVKTSVRPYPTTRVQYGTLASMGFPFRFAIPHNCIEVKEPCVLKLAFHPYDNSDYNQFDCGSNQVP